MNKNLLLSIFCVVFLFIFGCSGLKFGSRMQYAIDTSNQLNKTQPAPDWDIPVDYHGADILRFVDNQSLLVGSATFDVAGTPEYGPVIMYNMNGMTEKWRIPRERHYTARHHFVAYHPNLIMRTAFQGQITHTAYDLASGNRIWAHSADDKSLHAYRYSPLFDITNLYILSDRMLKNIDARTGDVKWQATTQAIDTSKSTSELISLEDILVLVSAEKIIAYDQKDGLLVWSRSNPLSADFNALSGSKGIFLYGKKTAVHVNVSGKMDWKWQSSGGNIKLITPHEKETFIITHHKNSDKDALHAVDAGKQKWTTVLPGNVMSPLLYEKGTLYVTTAPQETESGSRSIVGISARSGKILVHMTLDPSSVIQGTAYVPLPDKLILWKKTLFVLREQYGITALDPDKKKTAWTQPLFWAAKAENLSLISRLDPEFNLALTDQYDPSYVSSNLKAGQTALNNQLKYQHMQQSMANFTRERPHLGDSVDATSASMKLHRDLNLAASAIVAMNELADASNAFWKAFGESLIQKTNIAAKMTAITGIRIAEAQYQAALSNKYFVPAPTENITIVDLNTGKRADFRATLAIPNLPGRAWTVALSPDETKLAVVGIGLNHKSYRRINRGMLEVPGSSLVVYHTGKLNFIEQMKVPGETVVKVPETSPPSTTNVATVSPDASYMIKAGYPALVAYAMHGTVADIKKALAAGENVNAPYAAYGLTPLMAATNRGDVAIVKLLLDSGADVHAKSVFGKTAYNNLRMVQDPAVRTKIKKLLDSAAKKNKND